MQKKIFLVVFFICLGITTEVFFTAIFEGLWDWNERSIRLEGHTYVWMAPIYALIPLLFPIGIKLFGHWHILIRAFLYMIFIFIIEFISGFLLETITGYCPWDYTGKSKWEIMGYIRLDFFAFWMFFGIMVEKFYLFLQAKIKD